MTEEEDQEPRYYTESVREAIYRHRRADPEKYSDAYI